MFARGRKLDKFDTLDTLDTLDKVERIAGVGTALVARSEVSAYCVDSRSYTARCPTVPLAVTG